MATAFPFTMNALANCALESYLEEFPGESPDQAWFTTAYEMLTEPAFAWAEFWAEVQALHRREQVLTVLADVVTSAKRGVGTAKDEDAFREAVANLGEIRRQRRAGRLHQALDFVVAAMPTVAALPQGLAEQVEHRFRGALGVKARLPF